MTRGWNIEKKTFLYVNEETELEFGGSDIIMLMYFSSTSLPKYKLSFDSTTLVDIICPSNNHRRTKYVSKRKKCRKRWKGVLEGS